MTPGSNSAAVKYASMADGNAPSSRDGSFWSCIAGCSARSFCQNRESHAVSFSFVARTAARSTVGSVAGAGYRIWAAC